VIWADLVVEEKGYLATNTILDHVGARCCVHPLQQLMEIHFDFNIFTIGLQLVKALSLYII
jgi:hypothetical protein